jgi:hypothetical protein
MVFGSLVLGVSFTFLPLCSQSKTVEVKYRAQPLPLSLQQRDRGANHRSAVSSGTRLIYSFQPWGGLVPGATERVFHPERGEHVHPPIAIRHELIT